MSRMGNRVFLALERDIGRLSHVGSALDPVRDRGPGVLRDRLDEPADPLGLTDRDAEADPLPAGRGDDGVGIEAAVGPDGQLAHRPGIADSPSGPARPGRNLSRARPGGRPPRFGGAGRRRGSRRRERIGVFDPYGLRFRRSSPSRATMKAGRDAPSSDGPASRIGNISHLLPVRAGGG